MKRRAKSRCPVCYGLDIFGDRWTLLIIRDLLFRGRAFFRDFQNPREGIATNILSERLKRLVEQGLAVRETDVETRQPVYLPTKKGEALRPVLDAMSAWAADHGPKGLTIIPPRQG